ncbi:DUF1800 domain-containing protein [Vibrio neptunius]|uniref:DUF1800 domain-containing protein n=1 Tax=Vibrio neptunius TaxID=170651 RepID=UPI001C5CABBF|nr:DUF1800 domain-containing protein [Vibrio neptunius]QXX05880.1 DUF1800 domain-containing protein [Vibrio neptunius]
MTAKGDCSFTVSASPHMSYNDAVRFLNQTTFGAQPSDISLLSKVGPVAWIESQLNLPPSYLMPRVKQYINAQPQSQFVFASTSFAFWKNAIESHDQLRQRMAFALSQIFVVSNGVGDELTEHPEAVASFEDLLIKHAFGNFRTLLEEVTYSPAMGYYLTYLGNVKADPERGNQPDENYARELLQLFTIGVEQLNPDGSPILDTNGQPIETYSNSDVRGLARVFTGLNVDESNTNDKPGEAFSVPMTVADEELHSSKEKRFLGTVIPKNTPSKRSITLALDAIFAHPNVGPFISKQLIQRLVTSNPSPAYIARVSSAFDSGSYELAPGKVIGQGIRGDLSATLMAVLFEAKNHSSVGGRPHSKVREPILRFTHWARAFNVTNIDAEYLFKLWDTSSASSLAQHPYRSPSVFNFYRPGYKAPGTISAQQNLVAPEMQIVNATSISGYVNFMTYFVFNQQKNINVYELEQTYIDYGMPIKAHHAVDRFSTQYTPQMALAAQPSDLVEHLNSLLTGGIMAPATKTHIVEKITQVTSLETRVKLAILLVMISPDYLVQR